MKRLIEYIKNCDDTIKIELDIISENEILVNKTITILYSREYDAFTIKSGEYHIFSINIKNRNNEAEVRRAYQDILAKLGFRGVCRWCLKAHKVTYERYCDECFNKKVVTCEIEYEMIDIKDSIQVDGKYFNKKYKDDPYYFKITTDGKKHFCRFCHSIEGVDGLVYKDDLCKYDITNCCNCGKRILRELAYNDKYCSEKCMLDELTNIRDYHENPDRYYFDENSVTDNDKNFKGYGVELEVDQYYGEQEYDEENDEYYDDSIDSYGATSKIIKLFSNEDASKHKLYFMHDGSLNNGFEIITQPHTEKALKDIKWKEILQILRNEGWLSNDVQTCGLHIHASRNLFGNTTLSQDRNISKIVYFYEWFWDDIVKISRRNNCEILDWAKSYCRSSYNAEADKKRINKIVKDKDSGRYYAVNLENKNTIEFRIFRGTLNYDTFRATIDFTTTICKNAKKITNENLTNIDMWLDGIEENTRNYLNSRKAFLKGENN